MTAKQKEGSHASAKGKHESNERAGGTGQRKGLLFCEAAASSTCCFLRVDLRRTHYFGGQTNRPGVTVRML